MLETGPYAARPAEGRPWAVKPTSVCGVPRVIVGLRARTGLLIAVPAAAGARRASRETHRCRGAAPAAAANTDRACGNVSGEIRTRSDTHEITSSASSGRPSQPACRSTARLRPSRVAAVRAARASRKGQLSLYAACPRANSAWSEDRGCATPYTKHPEDTEARCPECLLLIPSWAAGNLYPEGPSPRLIAEPRRHRTRGGVSCFDIRRLAHDIVNEASVIDRS